MPAGREQQVAGVSAETRAAADAAGFLGWSPDPDRTVYAPNRAANKKSLLETAVASGRLPQYHR